MIKKIFLIFINLFKECHKNFNHDKSFIHSYSTIMNVVFTKLKRKRNLIYTVKVEMALIKIT